MGAITANEIKAHGIAALEAALENAPDAVISVRGKDRFVVMDIAHYRHLRECELESALHEAKALRGGSCASLPRHTSIGRPGPGDVPYELVFPESYNRRAARFLRRCLKLREQYRLMLELLA